MGGRKKQSTSDYPCTKCGVATDKLSIQCSFCCSWTHRPCITNCQEVLNYLTEPNSPFCCHNCQLDTIIDEFRQFRLQTSTSATIIDAKSSSSTDHELSELKKQVSTLITTIQPLLKIIPKHEPTKISQSQSTLDKPSYAFITKKKINQNKLVTVADVRQIQTDDIHSRSIVIANLPEHGNDTTDVGSLCSFLDPSVQIIDTYRLGVFCKDSRPRLLKVILRSAAVAKSILTNSKLLKTSVDYKNVYLRKSLSKHDRVDMANRRKLCYELNSPESFNAGTKFVLVDGNILKYMNCTKVNDHKLGRGSLDKSFKASTAFPPSTAPSLSTDATISSPTLQNPSSIKQIDKSFKPSTPGPSSMSTIVLNKPEYSKYYKIVKGKTLINSKLMNDSVFLEYLKGHKPNNPYEAARLNKIHGKKYDSSDLESDPESDSD